MKKLVILLLFAVAACTKTPPPQFAWDKAASFADFKTFAWYDDPDFKYPHGASIVDGRFIDENVRRDVEQELARKGYRKEDAGSPDFLVIYHASSDGVSNRDVYGEYYWWSPTIYAGSMSERHGTLTLDIRDRGKKLIWRGVTSRTSGSSVKQIGEQIDLAVRQLLAHFPPAPQPSAPQSK